MRVLWEAEPLTVAEIIERLPKEPKPAYTSLLTAVRSMEKKGLLTHVQEGKAYLYSAVLRKSQFRRSSLRRLIGGIFEGDAYAVAVNLIKEEKLDGEEIRKLRQLLEKIQ